MNIAEASPPTRRKVPNACQRCRRQKLKCDVSRPCALCQRAGVACQPCPEARWRVYQQSHPSTAARPPKRSRTNGDDHQMRPASTFPTPHLRDGVDTTDPVQNPLPGPAWSSSSTMSLVDGAFHLHNSSTESATTAIPGGKPTWDSVQDECTRTPARDSKGRPRDTAASSMPPFHQSSRSTVGELVELLPPYEAAALLVDTYFDRVHWFMLIFHQDEFRRRWPGLYCSSRLQPQEAIRDIGFLGTFLMVIGIGLEYAGDYRRQRLSDLDIDPDSLKQRILSSIKTRLLDIVSLGTLETVQTCILLGTYYLYHGTPRLASPVCGCGLRVAQALNLHRRMAKERLPSGHQLDNWQMANESRKRSWWAIYEIETFSSMTYGYPHSIKDSDYDVEPLNPSAKLQGSHPPTSFEEPLTGGATLLSYKYYMSKLSVLTKEALTELYGIGGPTEATKSGHPSTNLRDTIEKTRALDARLVEWNAELPSKLQWNQTIGATAYASADELDRDVGAAGPRFENHIYELQALALKLAYENARILVHRPLLSYKLVATPSMSESAAESTRPGPFHHALEICRHSALRISELIDSPIMDLVGATYAAAFVSMHTFAAGVLLAILSSMAPLSPESQEAKIGLHRLMGIQEKLRDRCTLAAQGLEILQRLTKLVMEKELNTMLDLPNSSRTSKDVHPPDECADSQSTPVPMCTAQDQGPNHEDGVWSSGTSQPTGSVNPTYTVSNGENPDSSLQYIEDPALSEALFDFDQALLNFAPRSSCDPNEGASSRFLADDGFPMLEQTWIWGLDNNPSFGGH